MMTTEHPEPGRRVVGSGQPFETVMYGYDKRQVDVRVAELQARISALETALENARRKVVVAPEDDLPATHRQRGPRHERVSERVTQILRLADEEAQQAREEAQQARDEASRQAAALLERARAEACELLEAARSTAEEVLRAAMRRSQEELAAAREEASRLVRPAREEAAAVAHDGDEPRQAPPAGPDQAVSTARARG